MLITSIDDIKENVEGFKENLGEQLKFLEGTKRFSKEKHYTRGQYDMVCLFADWIEKLEENRQR